MTDNEQRKIFAQNLNKYLQLNGKSQKEVADAIAVSYTHLRAHET